MAYVHCVAWIARCPRNTLKCEKLVCRRQRIHTEGAAETWATVKDIEGKTYWL